MCQVLRLCRVQKYHRRHQATHDWSLRASKSSCPLPKTCKRRRFLPHIWLVCGNGHVLITTFTRRRNDFLWSGIIYLSSAWRDESENVHCDANRSIFFKTKFFLLHFLYEELWFFQELTVHKIGSVCVIEKPNRFLQMIFFYH